MQAAKYGIREFSQMKVLVINAGSSSLKYQLLDTESGEVMAKGLCERIGIDGVLTHTGNKSDEKFKFDIAMPTHKEAIQSVINILLDPEKGVISSMSEIDAVGHTLYTAASSSRTALSSPRRSSRLSRTAYRWHRFTIRLT